MIIYGTKATLLTKETVVEKCQNCGKINTVEISVFQKYAHVFWIPFFPIGKTGISQCQHCKEALKLKEMPEPLRVSYSNLKQQLKAPIWTFSGLALVAVLITWGIVSEKQNDARNAKLIQAPQKGDIFEVRSGSNYTLYKVQQVLGDTVYILYNQYETNKISGLADLKKKGNTGFADIAEPFLKKEIKAMFDDGDIIDIDRQ
ncbi:MAG TPA: hypothetical protein VIZ28_08005 [Chitinophagaceae bacterium]